MCNFGFVSQKEHEIVQIPAYLTDKIALHHERTAPVGKSISEIGFLVPDSVQAMERSRASEDTLKLSK